MAQIRTRKDKEKAQKLRLKDVSNMDTVTSPSSYSYTSNQASKKQPVSADTLLKVDSRYIVRDLWKTISISSILLCAVIGIYFYLRYN